MGRLDNINGTCINKCITDEDYDEIQLKCLEKILKKGYFSSGLTPSNPALCMAVSENSYVIDPRGNFFKCLNTIGDENEKIGDILNGFNNNNNKLNKWLEYTVDDMCKQCNKLPMCRGGCPFKKIKNVGEEFRCIKDPDYYNKALELMTCYLGKYYSK